MPPGGRRGLSVRRSGLARSGDRPHAAPPRSSQRTGACEALLGQISQDPNRRLDEHQARVVGWHRLNLEAVRRKVTAEHPRSVTASRPRCVARLFWSDGAESPVDPKGLRQWLWSIS